MHTSDLVMVTSYGFKINELLLYFNIIPNKYLADEIYGTKQN